jgi:hypothetical protein
MHINRRTQHKLGALHVRFCDEAFAEAGEEVFVPC